MKEKSEKRGIKKSLFSLVFAVAMVISILQLNSVNVFAKVDGGKFGEDDCLTWEYDDETKTLTVSGNGEIPENSYANGFLPWHSTYRKDIETIIVRSGVTRIGKWAFSSCYNLTSVIIEDGVTEIGVYAFMESQKLTSIELPASVTTIGEGAFRYSENLESITLKSIVPPTLGADAFKYCATDIKINVPIGSGDSYKNASGWDAYASVIDANVVIPHTHKWECVAKDNVLYVYCTEPGDCKYPGTAESLSNAVKLTLTASNAKYSGDPVVACFAEGEEDAWKAVFETDVPAIVYEAKSGSELTDGKAVKAGSYTAKITIDDITASVDFEIEEDKPVAPKTGDATPIALYVMLMAVAGTAVLVSKKRTTVR